MNLSLIFFIFFFFLVVIVIIVVCLLILFFFSFVSDWDEEIHSSGVRQRKEKQPIHHPHSKYSTVFLFLSLFFFLFFFLLRKQ